jgi:hypothetical protein
LEDKILRDLLNKRSGQKITSFIIFTIFSQEEGIMTLHKEIPLIGAAEQMEYLFQKGIYQGRKQSKDCLEQLKYLMRQTFSQFESNRNEFHGVVVKFVRVPVYETNTKGLKEYINDLGLLPKVVKLNFSNIKDNEDLEELFEIYKLPTERYARIFLNAKGKLHTQKREYLFDPSFEGMAESFLKEKKALDRWEKDYQKVLHQMENCTILKQSQTLKCSYGTVKLVNKDVEYDVESIYDDFGAKFLLDYGQISMEKLEEYITRKFISPKEVNNFRKQIDIQLRFVVMDLESERRSMEYLYKSMMEKSQIRRFA